MAAGGFRVDQKPKKQDITGASLGFTPRPIRPRVAGESPAAYARYKKLAEGEQARQVANARGINTSGMAWDGNKFHDANYTEWYADPALWGHIAPTAMSLGASLFGNAAQTGAQVAGQSAADAASSQVGTVSGVVPGIVEPTVNAGLLPATFSSPLAANVLPGASALAPGVASSAVPLVAQSSLPNFSSGVVENLPGNVASRLPAALATAGAGAGAATVANLFGNTPSTYTPDVPEPTNNQSQNQDRQNSQKTSFQLPFGITLKDLAGLGVGAFNSYMNNNSANNQTAAQAAADKAALDFAMRAYDETAAKEQARFEATEARRAPYRRASLDTLGEFKKLLWNTNEDV
jgi:hypothetical protein